MKKDSLKYELLLLVMSIIWGSTFAAQQLGLKRGLGPMTFNGLRFALGSLSLVPVILWRRRHITPAPEDAKFPVVGSIVAGLFLFAAASFQQVGLQYTSSANAGFITGFYILFVPLIGIALGHRAPRSLWAGLVICLVGLYFMSVTDGFSMAWGDLLILTCAFFWAGQILVIDHIASRGDSIQIACLQFVVCAVLSSVVAICFESCSLAALKAGAGPVVYAGLMSVGIAFTLQVVCQKRCSPAPAAIIMSLEAVFAAIAGYLVLGQTLGSRVFIGCSLILTGVLVTQLVPMIKKKPSPNSQQNSSITNAKEERITSDS